MGQDNKTHSLSLRINVHNRHVCYLHMFIRSNSSVLATTVHIISDSSLCERRQTDIEKPPCHHGGGRHEWV